MEPSERSNSTNQAAKPYGCYSQPMSGHLSDDFLRISANSQQQQNTQAQLHHQQFSSSERFYPSNITERLTITVIKAKLNKNYGVARMHPYVKLHVGHTIYETPTSYFGAKTPHWNKIIYCYLPTGVTSLYLEVFDERSFKADKKVAWGNIKIPEPVLNGGNLECWFPLKGQHGDKEEGLINLAFSRSTPLLAPVLPICPPVMATTQYYPLVMSYSHVGPVLNVHEYQQVSQPIQPVWITDDDIKQMQEMFPAIDREIIKTMLEYKRGNKDVVINDLLAMSNES
ncbi:toll-interacting protein A-like [Limulus polyphemus]|uniref:Toll-interacting protein A-like n=1 Tax=Limulus polyphemus TaxID=6850 RepID=A0ABM1RX05_LIMPO|nr:toll-interacting protein A-like [Limulus polyphemus]